jgi:hypothetical protein
MNSHVRADEAVMIGDDVQQDVCGALAVGMRGVLVRTGKYRTGDEATAGTYTRAAFSSRLVLKCSCGDCDRRLAVLRRPRFCRCYRVDRAAEWYQYSLIWTLWSFRADPPSTVRNEAVR